MGKCLATLLRGHCDLKICSRDIRRAERAAQKLGAIACGIEGCDDRQIVFMAVPTFSLPEMAGRVSNVMPTGSLLVDISSVKCGVVEKVDDVLPPHINYISIHPLFFSPRASEKNTIVVPVRPGFWLHPLMKLLESCGMRLKELRVEEHDQVMATVQVAHHFSLLALRATINRMGFTEKEDLIPFMTRSLGRSLSIIGSLEKNMETIEMIQRENIYSDLARSTFLEEARKIGQNYSKKAREHQH